MTGYGQCARLPRLACILFGLMAVLAVADGVRADPPAFAGRTVLLMVDDASCIFCRKWEREVGPGYSASAEGRVAPLLRRQKGHPELAGIPGLAYTPTFVLIANGREAGRIVGYAGEAFFWGEFDRLFTAAGLASPAPAKVPLETRTEASGLKYAAVDPSPLDPAGQAF